MKSQQEKAFLGCGFSPDGSYLAAGTSKGELYIWTCEALAASGKAAGSGTPVSAITTDGHLERIARARVLKELPAPRLLLYTQCHLEGVMLLQFSNGGDALATGSKDGVICVSHSLQLSQMFQVQCQDKIRCLHDC